MDWLRRPSASGEFQRRRQRSSEVQGFVCTNGNPSQSSCLAMFFSALNLEVVFFLYVTRLFTLLSTSLEL